MKRQVTFVAKYGRSWLDVQPFTSKAKLMGNIYLALPYAQLRYIIMCVLWFEFSIAFTYYSTLSILLATFWGSQPANEKHCSSLYLCSWQLKGAELNWCCYCLYSWTLLLESFRNNIGNFSSVHPDSHRVLTRHGAIIFQRQAICLSAPDTTQKHDKTQSKITANQKHVWVGSLSKHTVITTKLLSSLFSLRLSVISEHFIPFR